MSQQSSAPKTILLVDDHDLIRQGLARAFERSGGFDIVGQSGSVAEGWDAFQRHHPDVLVTDVRLPDGTGLELARRVRSSREDVAIVVLTMFAGDDQLFAAMEAGASAFVAKDVPADHVVTAARHALSSPRQFAAANLAEAMRRKMSPSSPKLSDREHEVLTLLASGLGVAAIASELFVSESTAKTHISKIYDKLGAANRAQAIMKAFRAGLLIEDEQR